jgi:STE20-like kinase
VIYFRIFSPVTSVTHIFLFIGSTLIDAVHLEPKLNKSTVTITSDLHEDMNSSTSCGNVTQVTVVTTHPPVLLPPVDSSTPVKPHSGTSAVSPAVTVTAGGDNSEVIIVANETNKTQINESSTDDDQYNLLDSLEYVSQPQDRPISIIKGKKLDESEVLIVSPSFVNVGDGDGYV